MKKIFQFLQKLFSKSKWLIQQYVKPSVAVVEALKTFIDSPAIPILTALIPGGIDDFVALRLRMVLPDVLKVLGYADECINVKNGDTIVQCAIARLRQFHPDGQAAAWHNIASKLSEYLSDGKLSWTEALHLSEMVYTETKKS